MAVNVTGERTKSPIEYRPIPICISICIIKVKSHAKRHKSPSVVATHSQHQSIPCHNVSSDTVPIVIVIVIESMQDSPACFHADNSLSAVVSDSQYLLITSESD